MVGTLKGHLSSPTSFSNDFWKLLPFQLLGIFKSTCFKVPNNFPQSSAKEVLTVSTGSSPFMTTIGTGISVTK